jgi:hypothetical protein
MDMWKIFLQSFRLYFAPLIGAYRGVRAELKRRERERCSSDGGSQ